MKNLYIEKYKTWLKEIEDGPWGHYAKWNKSNGKRQNHVASLIYGMYFFLKKSKKTKLIDTETRLMIVKGGGQGFEINGWRGVKGKKRKSIFSLFSTEFISTMKWLDSMWFGSCTICIKCQQEKLATQFFILLSH